MPPPGVTALADRVRAQLKAGGFAGLELAAVGLDDVGDAERAVRIVLADVAYWARFERERGHPVPAERWHDLADQLRRLLELARGRGPGPGCASPE